MEGSHCNQRELPLRTQRDDEGSQKHRERLDEQRKLLSNPLVDTIAIRRDLSCHTTAALYVTMPDLLAQRTLQKRLSQPVSRPNGCECDTGGSHVCGNESTNEQLNEPQHEGVAIASELLG